jgi:hypothetical protein
MALPESYEDVFTKIRQIVLVSSPENIHYLGIAEEAVKKSPANPTAKRPSSHKPFFKAAKSNTTKLESTRNHRVVLYSGKAYPRVRVLPSLQLSPRAKVVYLEDISSWVSIPSSILALFSGVGEQTISSKIVEGLT